MSERDIRRMKGFSLTSNGAVREQKTTMMGQISHLEDELTNVKGELNYQRSLAVVGEVMSLWDDRFKEYLNTLDNDTYDTLQASVNKVWRNEGDRRRRQSLHCDLSLYHVTKYSYDCDTIDSILNDFERKQGWSLRVDNQYKRVCDKVVQLQSESHDIAYARNEKISRVDIEKCLMICCKELKFDTSKDEMQSILNCLPETTYPLDNQQKRRS